MIKKCTKCGVPKGLEEFQFKNKALGRRNSWCRSCVAPHQHSHYLANKQRYIEENSRRRRELRDKTRVDIENYFKSHPCADCGEADPVALDFHHVLGDKKFEIGQYLSYSIKKLWPEIRKCIVLCSNCHRKRHFKEKTGNYRGMGSAA
jgi:hypothetical protein